MHWQKYIFETATLILAAALCAFVSNAMASRERKLVVSSVSKPAVTPVAAAGLKPAAPPITPAPVAAPVAAPAPQPAAAPQKTPLELPVKSAKQAGATTTPTPDAGRPTPSFNTHPDKAYVEIAFNDVAYLHSKGALFLDARRTSIYEQGHIPGARPFSVWESDIDDKVNKLFAERPDPAQQNQPIVAYCSGGDCEDSHMLAQKLWGIGFNNVYVYKDGFPDWQKRGDAVHTGANP